MIRVTCPKCEKPLQVDDSKAGVLVKCPRCQEKFRVPPARAGKEPAVVKFAAAKPGPARESKPAPAAADQTSKLQDDMAAYGVEKDDHGEEEDGEDLVAKHVTRTKRRERREQAFDAVLFPSKLISIPAIVILIGAIIYYLFWMWQLLMYNYKIKNKEIPEVVLDAPAWVVVVTSTASIVGAAIAAGMVVAGAEKMKKLENYPWAFASCFFLPFGVLGLMVMLRPEVKSEFDRPIGEGKAKKGDAKAKKSDEKKPKKK